MLSILVVRVAGGDRGAFRALFELLHGQVFGLCLRLLRNRSEAEEVLQDVFVRVWNKAASYRGESAPTQALAWVLTIARNRCLEILRRRGVNDGEWNDTEAHVIADERPTPEQDAMHAETARSIADCLRDLEEPQRQVIELAYYDGLSYAEAARRLARPVGTVKSQIRRGLSRLKRCLQRS